MSKEVSRIWEELEERENMLKIYCVIFKIKMLKIRFIIFLLFLIVCVISWILLLNLCLKLSLVPTVMTLRLSWEWWHVPLICGFGKKRWAHLEFTIPFREFKASLGYLYTITSRRQASSKVNFHFLQNFSD